jgi:hypothetical protein
MANSQSITNRNAQPRVLNNARLTGSVLMSATERVTMANDAGHGVGTVHRLFELPSNAVISRVFFSAPDIGTTTAADVGLYRTTADGAAVVDADFFASAQALNAGPYDNVDITRESTVITAANRHQPIWQILGLSADPQVRYDVALTMTGAADAAGSVDVTVQYTV